ncbi:hypothetical protein PV433_29990 [Paenibacillus sp. GYB004]|uniref:hypothetical protein n=1 Tax=Paenibacillus sp. GYB004 TaxID=2994393 RepID=UPI002F96260A
MRKIIIGWIIVTGCYFIVLMFLSKFISTVTGTNIVDNKATWVDILSGLMLIVIPYILGGMYSRAVFENSVKGAFYVSLIPVFAEKILIFLIGRRLVGIGADAGSSTIMTPHNIFQFIQNEAAPYYSIYYLAFGLLSIPLCVAIAKIPPNNKKRNKSPTNTDHRFP